MVKHWTGSSGFLRGFGSGRDLHSGPLLAHMQPASSAPFRPSWSASGGGVGASSLWALGQAMQLPCWSKEQQGQAGLGGPRSAASWVTSGCTDPLRAWAQAWGVRGFMQRPCLGGRGAVVLRWLIKYHQPGIQAPSFWHLQCFRRIQQF